MYEDDETGMVSHPTFQSCVQSVSRNGYCICLGRLLTNGQAAIVDLTGHILLTGRTASGKTCQAAQIIEQAIETHDSYHLQIGLFDPSHETRRLFGNHPHVAQIGELLMRAFDAEDIAARLHLLAIHLRDRIIEGHGHGKPRLLVHLDRPELVRMRLLDPETHEQFKDDLSLLLNHGRQAGIFLMVSTQDRPYNRTAYKSVLAFSEMGRFTLNGVDRCIAPVYDVRSKLSSF